MASFLIQRLNVAITRFEYAIINFTFARRPPDAFAFAGIIDCIEEAPKAAPFSLKELIGDGFLWGVPRCRRTIERRQKRRFGHPDYVMKLLRPNTRLRTCNTCGDDYEAGVLCPTCYKKVIDETRSMQDQIQSELKLEPVEKEVVVLYEGEKDNHPDEFWQGKRIVEMKKLRPSWFSKNLLQQTTQQPASTSDIKPSDLG